jgi:hypothetical protein
MWFLFGPSRTSRDRRCQEDTALPVSVVRSALDTSGMSRTSRQIRHGRTHHTPHHNTPSSMGHIIREVTKTALHPNNFKQGTRLPSDQVTETFHLFPERSQEAYITWGHADPCTLPFRALTSLHPDIAASFQFHSLQHNLFLRPAKPSPLRVILHSYWFAQRLCEGPTVSFHLTGKPNGNEAHSSISLLLPK